MNSDGTSWSEIGATTFTSTTDSITYNVDSTSALTYNVDSTSALSYTTNTTWNFLNNYSEWPKGISDYSFEKKYTPKWHIFLGYKNQMDIMWD